MSRPEPCPPPDHLNSLIDALPSSKRNLAELYHTAWTEIPTKVLSRIPPYLLQSELVSILDYKLAFGQNRPTLRGMIKALNEQEVKAASTTAFGFLVGSDSPGLTTEDTLKALRALTVLRGIGPATASLVLSLLSSSVAFFSDEVAVVMLQPAGGRKGLKYTESEYKRFAEAIRTRSGSGRQRELERRIWVKEMAKEIGLQLEEDIPSEKETAGTEKVDRKRGDFRASRWAKTKHPDGQDTIKDQAEVGKRKAIRGDETILSPSKRRRVNVT